MKWGARLYGVGLLFLLFGGAGISDNIVSNEGSFPISAVVFGIGLILVLWSYIK